MDTVVTVLAFGWAISGVVAAFASGKPGVWRAAIWLGPIAFFVFPPEE